MCAGFCRILNGPLHVYWYEGVKGLVELDFGILVADGGGPVWVAAVRLRLGDRSFVMHDPDTGFLATAVCEPVCQEVM